MEQLTSEQIVGIISLVVIAIWIGFILYLAFNSEPRESQTDRIMKGLRDPMWKNGHSDQSE